MFPFRHSSIFRSRWMALLWAAGIVWFAVDVAGAPDDGASNASAADAGGAVLDPGQMKETRKLLQDLGR